VHLRRTPHPISWGRPKGSGLSAMVVSTKAHLWDVTTYDEWRASGAPAVLTLCGTRVPQAVLPGHPGPRTIFSKVYTDSPSETAKQPMCKRCQAVMVRLSSNVDDNGRPMDGGA
jgi:hypothetical protein